MIHNTQKNEAQSGSCFQLVSKFYAIFFVAICELQKNNNPSLMWREMIA